MLHGCPVTWLPLLFAPSTGSSWCSLAVSGHFRPSLEAQHASHCFTITSFICSVIWSPKSCCCLQGLTLATDVRSLHYFFWGSVSSQQMVTCMQPFGSTLCFFFHDFRPVVQTVLLRKGRKNNLNQTQKRGLPELNPSHDNQYNCCFILVLNRITRGRDYDL